MSSSSSNSKKPNHLANLDMSKLQHMSGSLNLSNVQHHNQHGNTSGASTPRTWFDMDEMGIDYGGELFSDEHFLHIATPTSAIGSPTWSAVTSAASSACNSPRGISGDSMKMFNEEKLLQMGAECEDDENKLEEEEVRAPKPLNHKWYIYMNSEMSNQSGSNTYDKYFVNDKKIGEFCTVQSFWSHWNHLNANHDRLPTNYTLKFFKKSLNDVPVDEFSPVATPMSLTKADSTLMSDAFEINGQQQSTDFPALRPGGKWSVFCYDKDKRENLWTELLLAAIGEVDYFGRRTFDILGVVFQSNANFDSVYIWSGTPQLSTRNIQKMSKRISHIVTSDEVGLAVGDDLFIEFNSSHFGKNYTYTSSKGNSRSGSGYSSPTKPASRSGYSSPMFRASKTPQYSPRFNHQHFHTKLKEKLHQRLGARIDNTPSAPSGTGANTANTTAQSDKEVKRTFGEKKRRISLNNGEDKIVSVENGKKQAKEEGKKVDNTSTKQRSYLITYLLCAFALLMFSMALKKILTK